MEVIVTKQLIKKVNHILRSYMIIFRKFKILIIFINKCVKILNII